jgi:hypothetical protein
MKYVALALLSVLTVGCTGISVNPEDAIAGIHSSATIVTSAGFQALGKDPATYEKVKAVASSTRDSINTVVLPFINGATVGQTSRDALDFTLDLLDKRLDPTVRAVIQSAINVALSVIKMPENPTDKLTADQKKMLLALFNGIVDGINEFIALGPPNAANAAKATATTTQKLTLSGTK